MTAPIDWDDDPEPTTDQPEGPIGWARQQQAEREQAPAPLAIPRDMATVLRNALGRLLDGETEQRPARHTADTINDNDLDQLYARLATLEHVAERNTQAYKLLVRDTQAATQLLKEGKAALRQAKLDQLTDREAISYWTHQTRLARDYSEHDSHALASTVLQARRWAARAKQAEAAIARARAECDRIEAAIRHNPTSADLAGGYLACLRHIRAALDEPKEPRP